MMTEAGDRRISRVMVEAAVNVAAGVGARALFAYMEALDDESVLAEVDLTSLDLILVAKSEMERHRAEKLTDKVLDVPDVGLTRMGRIKTAVVIAFSKQMLVAGETFVFLSGVADRPMDTLVVMNVGAEYEIFQSVDQPKLTEHIRRAVFERVFTLAIEVADQGREGKPVGAMFVVGDYPAVHKYCQQNIINPFKGYDEKERNILDDAMVETVKEFCSIDGAFVVKGTGVIMSAGTTLRPGLAGEKLPLGLGARHSAAAGITASTHCIAITISESDGTVRVWRRGQMITEIGRATRVAPPRGLPGQMPPVGD